MTYGLFGGGDNILKINIFLKYRVGIGYKGEGMYRYQGIAGKYIGGKLYAHSSVAGLVIPCLAEAKSILGDSPAAGFSYNVRYPTD